MRLAVNRATALMASTESSPAADDQTFFTRWRLPHPAEGDDGCGRHAG